MKFVSLVVGALLWAVSSVVLLIGFRERFDHRRRREKGEIMPDWKRPLLILGGWIIVLMVGIHLVHFGLKP